MSYRVFAAGRPNLMAASLELSDSLFHFPTLEIAIRAAGLLYPDPYLPLSVRHFEETVWENPVCQDWRIAAGLSPLSLEWSLNAEDELGPLLKKMAFGFGDWQVTFEFKRQREGKVNPVYRILIVVKATRTTGSVKIETAGDSDIVNSRGSLQRARFRSAMPIAAADWEKLPQKPAPYHKELVAHVHEQLLPILDRFFQFTSRSPAAVISFGDAVWQRSIKAACALHPLIGTTAIITTPLPALIAAHNEGCAGHDLLTEGFATASSEANRPVDMQTSLQRLTSHYCCDLGAFIEMQHHHLASKHKTVAGPASANDCAILFVGNAGRFGAARPLVEDLEEIIRLLPTDNWLAQTLEPAPRLLRGAGLDERCCRLLDLLERTAFESLVTTASGITANLAVPKLYSDSGFPVADTPTARLTSPALAIAHPHDLDHPNSIYAILARAHGHSEAVELISKMAGSLTAFRLNYRHWLGSL